VVLPAALSETKVIGFNNQGQSSETKVKLVYSTEFAKSVEENTDLTKKPTAYVGTITDISSGTIQIKDENGDIKQISLLKDTKFINTLKKNIEVKSTDLAIGDYIIAMGFVNGNKVLKTQRLLITSPIEENKFEAKKITKPVVALIAGKFTEQLPQDTVLGHAGAIVSKGKGSAKSKIAALRKAGAYIASTPEEIPILLKKVL